MAYEILFISHDASLSGAPKVLLDLLTWLKINKPKIKKDVLLIGSGVLEKDFINVADHCYFIKDKTRYAPNILQRGLEKIKEKLISVENSYESKLISFLGNKNYDLVYSNTVISVPYAALIKQKRKGLKHIAHIHELQLKILSCVPNFDNYIKFVDVFLVPSKIVKSNLLQNYSIPQEVIEVIPECSKVSPEGLIEPFNNKSGKFRIGASGLSYWRKGNDVFVQVARYLKKHHPLLNIEFIWVGNEYLDKEIILNDIEKMGLKNVVSFVGQKSNPISDYQSFDVFLLTSREDPFPLVCIEVGQMGKPIICFDNASGTAEIVKKGGGFVVSFLDIEAMAEKIVLYYHDRDLLERDGKKAIELFSAFKPEIICPKYFELIEKVIDNAS